jgi:hypothetical protein
VLKIKIFNLIFNQFVVAPLGVYVVVHGNNKGFYNSHFLDIYKKATKVKLKFKRFN